MDDSEEPDTVIFSERDVLSDENSIAPDEVQERIFVQDDEEEYKSLVCSPKMSNKKGENMS